MSIHQPIAYTLLCLAILCGGLTACSSSPVQISDALEQQIDPALTFPVLVQDAGTHTGKVIRLGGAIISANASPEGTQLEVLQLPVDDWHYPTDNLQHSGGRFHAVTDAFHDPATLAAGTKVTLVGTVTGSEVGPLDETTYRFPIIAIEHLHVWKQSPYPPRRMSPRWSIGAGGAFGGRVGGGIGIGIGF